MYRETLDWSFREFVKFMFRPRGVEGKIAIGCVPILLALLGGNWLAKVTVGGNHQFELGSTNFIPDWVQWPLVALFTSIFVSCFWLMWKRFHRENEIRNRKKVIVLEGRGLREDNGAPLAAAVPAEIEGLRIPLLLDLRQRRDGIIVEPQELLPEVDASRRSVQQHLKQNDRQDVTLVYGGLTPVPMTFLTGIVFDDEGNIFVMDWDRSREKWRSLNDADDGQRFMIEGLNGVGSSAEVVLAVSASYVIKPENIMTTFDHPVVRLSLPDVTSSHWSATKQSALSQQFYDTAKHLEGKGISTIHLILAAQNSVAFNMGRRYDKRNLPSIIVYQFEANSEKRYPWGVRMPVRGESYPLIVGN